MVFGLTLLSACAMEMGQAADASRPEPINEKITSPGGAYLAGLSAIKDGDMATASDLLLQGLALDPNNSELRAAAFKATLQAGRPEAVELARDNSGGVAQQLLLANVDAKAGHWAAAEGRYAGLVRQGPIQLLQPVLVAWAQFGDGRLEAAMSTLRPLAEQSRFRATYALHAAIIADLMNHDTEAERYYRIAQSNGAGINLQTARIIASYYVRSGRVAQAQELFSGFQDNIGNVAISLAGLYRDSAQRPVRNAKDGLAEAYLTLATALRSEIAAQAGGMPEHGKRGTNGGIVAATDMAMTLLELALDIRPDLTLAKVVFAEMLEDDHRPHAALAVLDHVSKDDPLLPMVQLRRAGLLASTGQQDAALKVLEALSTTFPDRAEPFSMRGDILRDQKRYPDAVQAYSAAIAHLGNETAQNWPLYYQRGIAYERARMWDKSEADLLHALQLAPEQPFILNYLAYSWTERGEKLDEARRMLERAVAARPDDAAIIDSFGWLLLRQGEVSGAVGLLQRAVEIEPADPTLNSHLGDAYWAAGRKLEAQFQWSRALSLDPESEDVAKLQAKLRQSQADMGSAPAKTQTVKATTP
jgi:tetratricopeptide (TPR) repeat protein